MDDIARVPYPRGFEQQRYRLFVGYGAVFHSTRHHHQIARSDVVDVIAVLDPESPGDPEEEFIFLPVVMPDELSLQPGKFDLLAVERGYGLRPPQLPQESRLLCDVDLHVCLSWVYSPIDRARMSAIAIG
jgi:hypothetical protein